MFKFSKKFLSLIIAILMLTMTAIGVNAEELITGIDDLLVDIGIIDPSPEEELMPMAAGGCYINGGMGFATFEQLKAYLGSPGAGREWHHIVEQCQIERSGFSPYMIHNTSNIIAVCKDDHTAISAYYSSNLSEGITVRDSLNGQSFEYQHEFGVGVLEEMGYY